MRAAAALPESTDTGHRAARVVSGRAEALLTVTGLVPADMPVAAGQQVITAADIEAEAARRGIDTTLPDALPPTPHAARYIALATRAGAALIPLAAGHKAALAKGWPKSPGMTADAATDHLARGGNLGVNLIASRLIVLDAEDALASAAVVAAGFTPTVQPAKAAWAASKKRGGSHTWLRVPADLDATKIRSDRIGLVLANGGTIDVLAGARYAVAPGSRLDAAPGFEYTVMGGGALDPEGDGAVPDAPAWLFESAAPCPTGIEALHGVLAPETPYERMERSAASEELTAKIDAISWEDWLAGDSRLTPTGVYDGRCGCPEYYFNGADNNRSATLHEGCELGHGAHIWSGTMRRILGLAGEHFSRLDIAAALAGPGVHRRDVAARVGIELRSANAPVGFASVVDLLEASGGDVDPALRASAEAVDARDAQRRLSVMASMRPLQGETRFTGAAVGADPNYNPFADNNSARPEAGAIPESVERSGVPKVELAPTRVPMARIQGSMPPRDAPLAVARELTRLLWTDTAGRLTLRRWRGDWIVHTGQRWAVVDAATLRQAAYLSLESATLTADVPGEDPERWNPTPRRVDAILDALGALVLQPAEVEPADGHGRAAVINGILDVRNRALTPHTPEFFSFTCLPYAFNPDAGEPVEWLKFLRSLWPDDVEPIALIQEWLGYIVSGETGRQKGLLLIGPPRSGKGTILWLIMMLVGAANAAGPTLASLCQQFGMAPLIGKSVANVGDARLGSSTSTTVLVERILSLIGEDEQQVDRKYRDPWTGKLRARLTIASNELPRFVDASAAVISRLLIAEMTNSFLGREDEHLKDRLAAELPAILNWALDGLDRLNANGKFTRPAASADTEQELEDLASPTKAFLRDECTIGAGKSAVKVDMYRRWENWCLSHGHQAGSQAWFARNLKACGISGGKESTGERRPLYLGVELKSAPSATAGAPGLMGNLTVVRAAG